MKILRILRDKARVDTAFAQITHLPHEPELQSHFARYLCVIVSGFIENSVEIVCSEYTQTRAHKNVQKFVAHKLVKFQNPKTEEIFKLFSEFDPTTSDKLKNELAEETKTAVDSVVNLRHGIAHGGTSGISIATIKAYYAEVLKFVEHIEKFCA